MLPPKDPRDQKIELISPSFLTEESREELTGKVRVHFAEFMNQFKQELTADIITGACNQSIPNDTVIGLLEKTFL